jgi:hypothetical protein
MVIENCVSQNLSKNFDAAPIPVSSSKCRLKTAVMHEFEDEKFQYR